MKNTILILGTNSGQLNVMKAMKDLSAGLSSVVQTDLMRLVLNTQINSLKLTFGTLMLYRKSQ